MQQAIQPGKNHPRGSIAFLNSRLAKFRVLSANSCVIVAVMHQKRLTKCTQLKHSHADFPQWLESTDLMDLVVLTKHARAVDGSMMQWSRHPHAPNQSVFCSSAGKVQPPKPSINRSTVL